jgi:hypothetical protein
MKIIAKPQNILTKLVECGMVFRIFDLLVMIVRQVRGDIFASSQKHIAFAVSTDGFNDTGFAGQVSSSI